jgi:UDP-N-acetylglucosamine 2-epimerase (non-hydrolysing)
MAGYFDRLRRFLLAHEDISLIFPVHPNPNVRRIAAEAFAGCARLHLVDPLPYPEFIRLLSAAWLIVSDSGGVQEEAPTLGVPLLVIRENTERPEAVECGAATLVGSSPDALATALDHAYVGLTPRPRPESNPFGDGHSGPRIAAAVRSWLDEPASGLG